MYIDLGLILDSFPGQDEGLNWDLNLGFKLTVHNLLNTAI